MLWHYTRREMKVLLLATLIVFSGYGFVLAHEWAQVVTTNLKLTANTVSVYAGVEPTEINTLAQQLDAREKDLDAREEALVRQGPVTQKDIRTLTVVSIVGAILLGLILLNFYLDSKRRYSLRAM